MKPDVYCPSCGQPMRLVRALPHAKGERDDINVFECHICKVSFTTEDHKPISGGLQPR
jgi:transposase-like protein